MMNTSNNNSSSNGQGYSPVPSSEQKYNQPPVQQAQGFNQNAQAQGYYQPQQAQSFNQNAQAQGYYQPQQAQGFNQNAQTQGHYQPQQAQSFNQNVQAQGYFQPQQAQGFNQNVQTQGYYQPQPAYAPHGYAPPYQKRILTPLEKLNAQIKYEKKQTRKLGNRTGWAVFAMCIVMLLLFVAIFYSIFSPFMSYTTYDNIQTLANSIASLISMVGAGILLMLITKTKFRDAITFKRTQSFKRCTYLFLVGLGAIPVCQLLAQLVASNLTLIGIENKDYGASLGTPEITPLYILINVICVAIVPAIGEEFLFRGAILGALEPYGQGFAIVMSSVIFGLVHGNLGQIPFAIAGGLFFGFLKVYSGSMIPSMILHGLNNLLAVIVDILNYVCDEKIVYAVMITYYTIFCIIAIFALAKLAKSDKNLFKFKRPKSKICEREKSVSFMLSPGFIVFLAYAVFETVSAYFMY